jgi:hypothetical protein
MKIKVKKVGSNSFIERGIEYKTDFYVMPKLKRFLEDKRISLACLIPEGWLWYEVTLFDLIDTSQDGKLNEEFGNKFQVIYNGISKKIDYSKDHKLQEMGWEEKVEGPRNKEAENYIISFWKKQFTQKKSNFNNDKLNRIFKKVLK